jgi:hypothetical protein
MTADTRLDLEGLRTAGFEGFVTFRELRGGKIADVPQTGGVYVVLHPKPDRPVFLDASPGGRFKGKDPTVPVDVLRDRWNKGTSVIYIGKGDQLRRRIKEFMRFGAGDPIGHWVDASFGSSATRRTSRSPGRRHLPSHRVTPRRTCWRSSSRPSGSARWPT